MAADRDALRIGDAAAGKFVDGGLRVGDKLFDVGVVAGFSLLVNDRHRGIVEHRVAGEEKGERTLDAQAHEFFWGSAGGDLSGGVGGEELAGVGPQQRGEGALVGRVTGWKIQRAGKGDAIGTLVADELFFYVGELGIGIGKFCQRSQRAAGEIAHKVVFRLAGGLARGEGARQRSVSECDEFFIVRWRGVPQAAGLFGREVKLVEERAVAVGRGAEAVEEKFCAVGAALEDETAGGVALVDRTTGVGVAVLRGAFEEQFAFAGRFAGGDAPGADDAGRLPTLGGEGEGVVAPRDGRDPIFETLLFDRRGIEGGRQREPRVALADGGGFFSGLGGGRGGGAAIDGLDPTQRRGLVGAPRYLPRAGAHGAGGGVARIIESGVGHAIVAAARAVDDVGVRGET